RTCPNCGNPGLGAADKICPRCGTRVQGFMATQVATGVLIGAVVLVGFAFGGEIIAAGGAVVSTVTSVVGGASSTQVAGATAVVAIGVMGAGPASAATPEPTATPDTGEGVTGQTGDNT